MGKESKINKGLAIGTVLTGGLLWLAAPEFNLPEIEKCQVDTKRGVEDALAKTPKQEPPKFFEKESSGQMPPKPQIAGRKPIDNETAQELQPPTPDPEPPKPVKITAENVREEILRKNLEAVHWLWITILKNNEIRNAIESGEKVWFWRTVNDELQGEEREVTEADIAQLGVSDEEADLVMSARSISFIRRDMDRGDNLIDTEEQQISKILEKIGALLAAKQNILDPLFLGGMGKTEVEFQDMMREIQAYIQQYPTLPEFHELEGKYDLSEIWRASGI